MRQDERAPFLTGLRRAREAAYPPGEHIGQESFMRATEIRRLARRAGIGPGVRVLDVCCGVGGPGRLITSDLGCRYLGVDSSASAVAAARALAGDLPCRFEQAHVPPLPDGPFEVVLLMETVLAFADKGALVTDVARVLQPGGRFAFTLEEGAPLTADERAHMPDADTVWLVTLDEMLGLLHDAGLTVTWQEQWSASHHETATALLGSFEDDAEAIAGRIGTPALTDLVRAHRLWREWLGSGRVRKFAVVAER